MTTHLKSAEGFVERLINDVEFRSRFEAHQSSAEAILAWAKSEGYDLAANDLKEVLTKRQETAAAAGANLSDQELQAINGGVVPVLGVLAGYFALGVATGFTVGAAGKIAEILDI